MPWELRLLCDRRAHALRQQQKSLNGMLSSSHILSKKCFPAAEVVNSTHEHSVSSIQHHYAAVVPIPLHSTRTWEPGTGVGMNSVQSQPTFKCYHSSNHLVHPSSLFFLLLLKKKRNKATTNFLWICVAGNYQNNGNVGRNGDVIKSCVFLLIPHARLKYIHLHVLHSNKSPYSFPFLPPKLSQNFLILSSLP